MSEYSEEELRDLARAYLGGPGNVSMGTWSLLMGMSGVNSDVYHVNKRVKRKHAILP